MMKNFKCKRCGSCCYTPRLYKEDIKRIKKAGYEVDKISRIMGIIGTKVRTLIVQGKEWKQLVPESICEYMRKIDGEDRIRKLSSEN